MFPPASIAVSHIFSLLMLLRLIEKPPSSLTLIGFRSRRSTIFSVDPPLSETTPSIT